MSLKSDLRGRADIIRAWRSAPRPPHPALSPGAREPRSPRPCLAPSSYWPSDPSNLLPSMGKWKSWLSAGRLAQRMDSRGRGARDSLAPGEGGVRGRLRFPSHTLECSSRPRIPHSPSPTFNHPRVAVASQHPCLPWRATSGAPSAVSQLRRTGRPESAHSATATPGLSVRSIANHVASAGLKARNRTAWGEAPGNRPKPNPSALKGRDIRGADFGSALQAWRKPLGHVTWASARRTRSSPGCHLADLRP